MIHSKKVIHDQTCLHFLFLFLLPEKSSAVWLNNLETPINKYNEFRGSTKIACLINHGKLTIQEFFLYHDVKKCLVHKD